MERLASSSDNARIFARLPFDSKNDRNDSTNSADSGLSGGKYCGPGIPSCEDSGAPWSRGVVLVNNSKRLYHFLIWCPAQSTSRSSQSLWREQESRTCWVAGLGLRLYPRGSHGAGRLFTLTPVGRRLVPRRTLNVSQRSSRHRNLPVGVGISVSLPWVLLYAHRRWGLRTDDM